MKKLCLAFGLLLSASFLAAQNTTVTATVVDSDTTVWANGTWTLSFQPAQGFPNVTSYTNNGSPLSSSVYSQTGTMNGSGVLSFTTYDSSLTSPGGSSWQLTLCPQVSVSCTTYNFSTAGSSMNISSNLTAFLPAPRFRAISGSYGYADVEAQVQLNVGSTYYNVTTPCQRIYSGTAWSCLAASGAGVTTFSAGNLPPIFTAAVANPTTTPALTFALTNVAQNAVLAGPTSGTGAPTYRALTTADIPVPFLSQTEITVAGKQRAMEYIDAAGTIRKIDIFLDSAVTDYSVAGTTGSFVWAFNQLGNNGGQVICHSGIYPIANPIIIDYDWITFKGDNRPGWNSSSVPTGAPGGCQIQVTSAIDAIHIGTTSANMHGDTRHKGIALRDLNINGTGVGLNGVFDHTTADLMEISGDLFTGWQTYAIDIQWDDHQIFNDEIQGNVGGLNEGGLYGKIFDNIFYSNTGTDFNISNGRQAVATGNAFGGSVTHTCIVLQNRTTTFMANTIDASCTGGVTGTGANDLFAPNNFLGITAGPAFVIPGTSQFGQMRISAPTANGEADISYSDATQTSNHNTWLVGANIGGSVHFDWNYVNGSGTNTNLMTFSSTGVLLVKGTTSFGIIKAQSASSGTEVDFGVTDTNTVWLSGENIIASDHSYCIYSTNCKFHIDTGAPVNALHLTSTSAQFLSPPVIGATKFTASGCTSITSTSGQGASGVFTIGANACTVVITINGATGMTAPTGWACYANDQTTAAGNTGLYFSTNNTTTATLTVPATAAASDVITFACSPY